MNTITKVFDKDGDLKVVFAKDRKDQIQGWLNLNNTSYEDAIPHAKEVDDRIFGKALKFPCSTIEN